MFIKLHRTMNAKTILSQKDNQLITIHRNELIATAANLLSKNNIGALVVLGDDEQLAGILSERDIIRSLALEGAQTLKKSVEELMVEQVITCRPDDEVKQLMTWMTGQRVRHLPVVDSDQLVGIVSIGDVMKHRLGEVKTEANVLRERILGSGDNGNFPYRLGR